MGLPKQLLRPIAEGGGNRRHGFDAHLRVAMEHEYVLRNGHHVAVTASCKCDAAHAVHRHAVHRRPDPTRPIVILRGEQNGVRLRDRVKPALARIFEI